MKCFISVLLLSLIFSVAIAQPTLTKEDFLNFSSSAHPHDNFTSSDVTGLSTIVATKGAAVMWTLTDRVWEKQTSGDAPTLYPFPGDAPFANDPDFSQSTHYSVDSGSTMTWNYFKITDDGYYSIGSAQNNAGTLSKEVVFSPPLKFFQFPLTFGTTWTSTSQGNVSGIQATFTITGDCDAYGSLTTPTSAHGKSQPMSATTQALRIKWSDSYAVFGQTVTQVNYDFFGSDHSMTIPVDQSDVPQKVDYSAPAGSNGVENISDEHGLRTTLSNNPSFGSQDLLSYELHSDGFVQITLTDPLGRDVQSLQTGFIPAGKHVIAIDQNQLSGGTYFIHVNANGKSEIQKLVVIR